MSEHTPGPWFLHVSSNVIQISDKQFHTNKSAIVHWMGFDGSDKPRDVKIANAAFIVKAVNNFDALHALVIKAQEIEHQERCVDGQQCTTFCKSLTETVAKAEAAPK